MPSLVPPVAAAQPADVPAPPAVSAQAVFTRDVSAGIDLYALNADEPRPPASTTKIATALVVVRETDLDEQVVIQPEDLVDISLYSHMGESGLIAGDTLTVEQLLWGTLLPSGSDAARALARHVGMALLGGSATVPEAVAAFVDEMNRLANDLGAQQTHFVNPDGADADGQVASARDLALLATALLEHDTLREMVATPQTDVVSIGPEQRLYRLVNTNDLLGQDGIIGVKTGTEVRAGGCLIIAAEREGNLVITVILGADPPVYDSVTGEKLEDQRFDDMAEILAAMERDYRWISVSDPEAIPGLAEALAAWSVTIAGGSALVIPAGAGEELTFRLRLGPPGPPESEVGRVLFFAGSALVGERVLLQV